MKSTIYLQVKKLLEIYPELRNDDMALIWKVWKENGCVTLHALHGEVLIKDKFMKFNHPETIRRSRAEIQKLHPELKPSKRVQELRNEKELEKGTFIFREEIKK